LAVYSTSRAATRSRSVPATAPQIWPTISLSIRLGDSAIDDQKRLLGARRELVHQPRQPGLAGAGFSSEQMYRILGPSAPNLIHQFHHRLGVYVEERVCLSPAHPVRGQLRIAAAAGRDQLLKNARNPAQVGRYMIAGLQLLDQPRRNRRCNSSSSAKTDYNSVAPGLPLLPHGYSAKPPFARNSSYAI
jgi:hypothetical protein